MNFIIEFVKDRNKRECFICKKNIKKGSIIVKIESNNNGYGHENKMFAHIDCMINKLQKTKDKFENIVPKQEVRF